MSSTERMQNDTGHVVSEPGLFIAIVTLLFMWSAESVRADDIAHVVEARWRL